MRNTHRLGKAVKLQDSIGVSNCPAHLQLHWIVRDASCIHSNSIPFVLDVQVFLGKDTQGCSNQMLNR